MIRFIDCISEGEHRELKSLSAFDHYFSYSGREYRAINPLSTLNKSAFEVEIASSDQHLMLTILKVISLFTLIVPLIMLIGKLICRSQYDFCMKGSHLVQPELLGKISEREPMEASEQQKIDQAKAMIGYFSENTIDNILSLGIKNQAAIIEIAKICAETNSISTAVHFKKFGITDQAARIEIATICAEKNPLAAAAKFENFDIIDQAARIEIAMACTKKNPALTIVYFNNFGIADQAARIKIAKICAEKDPLATVEFFQNFGITEEAARIEIAMICADKNPFATATNFKNFGISSEATQ